MLKGSGWHCPCPDCAQNAQPGQGRYHLCNAVWLHAGKKHFHFSSFQHIRKTFPFSCLSAYQKNISIFLPFSISEKIFLFSCFLAYTIIIYSQFHCGHNGKYGSIYR